MNRLSNNSKQWLLFILGFAIIFLSQYIFQTLFIFTGGVLLIIGIYYVFKDSVIFQTIKRLFK